MTDLGADRVVGVGVDTADVTRFERLVARGSERLWTHWYTDAEAAECRGHVRPAVAAATRFAVKEATYKAVGAHFSGPVRWREVEVLAAGAGWRIDLDGEVREAADRAGARVLHVSTSVFAGRVMATVVATGSDSGTPHGSRTTTTGSRGQ